MSEVYGPDDEVYGIERGEQMVAVQPRATPESSPEPIARPVSPPRANSGESAKSRRKVLPTKGDAFLLRTAYPNEPQVVRAAESYLPNADSESGDESMEDVADMDERLAEEMMKGKEKERPVETKFQSLSLQVHSEKRPKYESAKEEEMVDVKETARRAAPSMFRESRDDEEVAPDVRVLVPVATHAMQQLDTARHPSLLQESRIFVVPDPIDPSRRESNSTTTTTTTATTAPSRKASDGLGTCMKQPETPFTPMTPVEPNFQTTDPFSTSWPLSQHRGSMSSPSGRSTERLPSISGPTSPEDVGSPLPSAKELFNLADKANEALELQHRSRHASLSAMGIPSPPTSAAFARASFSGAHPSPSMTSEPRSALVVAPPSGVFRRESYPMASTPASIHSHSIGSPVDSTSPQRSLLTPTSPQRQHSIASIDENARTLPPIPGVGRPGSISVETIPAAGTGGYRCEFPGCTAAPFQTSYLLNSHANVHSTNRPHYCPVPNCPRGEGGKGFKRKNEMIRHGLVHDSPGYVCPFCPDREHKYPRPDNLLRHVRVHHTDKSREDPALRDVLAQRPDLAPNRGRRRRMGP